MREKKTDLFSNMQFIRVFFAYSHLHMHKQYTYIIHANILIARSELNMQKTVCPLCIRQVRLVYYMNCIRNMCVCVSVCAKRKFPHVLLAVHCRSPFEDIEPCLLDARFTFVRCLAKKNVCSTNVAGVLFSALTTYQNISARLGFIT